MKVNPSSRTTVPAAVHHFERAPTQARMVSRSAFADSFTPAAPRELVVLHGGTPVLQSHSATATGSASSSRPSPSGRRADVGNYLGSNYTDLGRVGANEQMPNPLDPAGAAAMRQAVAEDLDRLLAQGIDHVRVWAQHPNGLTDPQAIAERIRIIAEEAERRGITLTVDLFDAHATHGMSNYRAMEGELTQLIDTVVGRNAGFDNIQWSLGNEIADIEDPLAFAGWYEQMASRIRQAGGPGTLISAQLLPGSVNHPWASDAAMEAARRIVAASDVVSIHLYPEGSVGGQWFNDSWDVRSMNIWAELALQAGKPLTIGEFGLPDSLRSPEVINGWMQWFESTLGADHVSLWQFLKDDVGHVDGLSWDRIRDGGVDRSSLDIFRDGGWLGRSAQ